MLSHVAIWERVCARGGVDTALIFEDDVELAPNFEKRLRQYLRALPAGWELFHLKDDPLIPGFYYDERAQRECGVVVRSALSIKPVYGLSFSLRRLAVTL